MACADHTVPTMCLKPLSCNVAAFDGLLRFKVGSLILTVQVGGLIRHAQRDLANFATTSRLFIRKLQIDVMAVQCNDK